MSWKSFACVAALAVMVAPAGAQAPTAAVVDNMDGTATIQITTSVTGSLAAELAIDFMGTGATVTGATVNTAQFDDANPGDSPFIPGLAVGGDVTGLDVNPSGNTNSLFAAYGSGDLGVGTFDYLTFDYTGSGDVSITGTIAQLGANNDAAAGPFSIGSVPPLFGDFEPDGDVDISDFGLFADAFGSMTGDPNYDVRADAEPDGDVDISDFGLFADNFGIGTASAIPEPTTAVLGLIGLACLGARRRA